MCLLTVARALEMKQTEFLSKKEVWDKLQAMNGELEEHIWVMISDTDFEWWRWTPNIACHKICHGIPHSLGEEGTAELLSVPVHSRSGPYKVRLLPL